MPTFEEGDEELLKYTVDYIAFSYYRSNTVKTGEFDYERPAHECVNEKQIKKSTLLRVSVNHVFNNKRYGSNLWIFIWSHAGKCSKYSL